MPIFEEGGLFRLDTEETSYWLKTGPFGHLEHIYYGRHLAPGDAAVLSPKRILPYGTAVIYDETEPSYCLDTVCLEWSGPGKGDYRLPPCEIRMPDGSFISDFLYSGHSIISGCVPMDCLPTAYADEESGDVQTLRIDLKEAANEVYLSLFYTVFPKNNVITRRTVIRNGGEGPLSLRKFMSMSMDMPDRGFLMHSFDGGWIKEAHHHVRPVEYGTYVNSSSTGSSSNRSNPGFLLSERQTGEDSGSCWGFNLVYSGSHYGAVEKSGAELVRVMLGINPSCFDWSLAPGESFEAPEAVLSYSHRGFNGLRDNFHGFVNGSIVRGQWKNIARPVLLNNWEAHFFKFTHGKLLRLARRAKRLGVELFVLDDGWFSTRNSDVSGLGDYDTNLKKLPRGLEGLGDKIRAMGMDFGLWFEPEMVNPDSKLYRAHPDWVLSAPGRKPSMGRSQLVLDLSRPEVRDYIVENVGRIIDSAGLKYVKWDYNRNISDAFSSAADNQGELFHRYILGLYDVLGRIFRPRPHVLLESCASGGNRFDLGMLCFSPQIWASDNTDPVERLDIQGGLSYLYPQSCRGSHVSMAPHQQTLRNTPLSTRFNVAAFGCLGYELDLKHLSRLQRREIAEQIAFYKKYRDVFQYGRFSLNKGRREGTEVWQLSRGDRHICGFFQRMAPAAPGTDIISVRNLKPQGLYSFRSKPQKVYIKSFGNLVKHIVPVDLHPEGFVLRTANRLFALEDGQQCHQARGDMLAAGVALNEQFIGTGYEPRLRILGDFGSTIYTIVPKEDEEIESA